uniref:Uncharacterized protein n=1 Tax=Oryza meridionalis TaxID=40149 RepID=A0A0E0DNU1_9ORYZ
MSASPLFSFLVLFLPVLPRRTARQQAQRLSLQRDGADEGIARRGGMGVEEPAEGEGHGDRRCARWKRRQAVAELDGERRSRRHAKRVNTKLRKELVDAKRELPTSHRELERERRSREWPEKVYDELIRGGLAGGRGGEEEVEMRREAERAHEELEKEWEMLRLADDLRRPSRVPPPRPSHPQRRSPPHHPRAHGLGAATATATEGLPTSFGEGGDGLWRPASAKQHRGRIVLSPQFLSPFSLKIIK